AEDGIRARNVTGVQTCALPIWAGVFVVVIISGMNRPRTVPPHPALTLAKLSHELADLPRRTREREFVKVADELWLPSTADRDLRSEERRVGTGCRSRRTAYETR